MKHKKFWTLDKQGNEVLRDLEKENETFSIENFNNGKFDGNNYQWYEMFNHYVHDDIGCDYERYGCFINEGDVVLDIGANVGIFAHRAEFRGASKVICFEPLTPTFNCLIKNKGPKTDVYKMAVGGENKWVNFAIHTDYTHIGGGSSSETLINERPIIHSEKSYMINVNELFGTLSDRIDFLKVDIEGGEIEFLNTITDENLKKIKCFSSEFHGGSDDFQKFQDNFIHRMDNLGFNHFVLYHGNGNLRTINCWKR